MLFQIDFQLKTKTAHLFILLDTEIENRIAYRELKCCLQSLKSPHQTN